MTREAESAVTELHPQDAGRGKEGASPRRFGEGVALPTSRCHTSGPQNTEMKHFSCVDHPPPAPGGVTAGPGAGACGSEPGNGLEVRVVNGVNRGEDGGAATTLNVDV